MIPRAYASEFPHDNPELADGAVWLCPTVCAGPRPRREPAPLFPARRAPEAEPAAVAPERAAEPAPPTAFDRFVGAMVRVALANGATRAAAELPRLLSRAELSASLGAETLAVLRARGIVAHDAAVVTPEFRTRAFAWRDVLRGTSDDLSSCGATTLDQWAAGVLAAIAGSPQHESDALRRALRREGIAAFGLLEVA